MFIKKYSIFHVKYQGYSAVLHSEVQSVTGIHDDHLLQIWFPDVCIKEVTEIPQTHKNYDINSVDLLGNKCPETE